MTSTKETVAISEMEYSHENANGSEAAMVKSHPGKEGVIMESTNKETNDDSNHEGKMSIQSSHFGPWMLVQRTPKIKGRISRKEHSQSQQAKIKGSRFEILSTDNDEKMPNIEDSSIVVHTQEDRSNGKQSNSEDQNRDIVLEQNRDTNQIQKEKETEILHAMKIIQKQGRGSIDHYITHVATPSNEVINTLHYRNAQQHMTFVSSKPPDIHGSSIVQGSSMEIDNDKEEVSRQRYV
ncbi:hypothetical protein RIF29_19092 [Crotalaria pallida]|uniref:Uncharacterized protein n=1 Tax=Crotalaria pallida TaxID=3830 RepID=A0AAN9F779_CROPI